MSNIWYLKVIENERLILILGINPRSALQRRKIRNPAPYNYLCACTISLCMKFKSITDEDRQFFHTILRREQIMDSQHELFDRYAHDHTEDLHFNPDIVLLPETKEQISDILRYCNQACIAVTPRGAGTGLSGGALPIYGGVVLSVERMNAIQHIDRDNFQVTLQPGVINEALQQALTAYDLFYPPDPASKGSCMMGGNIAHSSGGPKAVKYGTTRDYVLNLEVVLPDGRIMWTGADTLKYSSGYNLTHLMIGSEGTLGIVSSMVLRVMPLPKYQILLLASFDSAEQACRAVNALFLAGQTPSVCEFVEPLAFELSSNLTGIPFTHDAAVKAYLLIEADGFELSEVEKSIEAMYTVLDTHGCINVLMADSEDKKNQFWRLRRSIGEATKKGNVYKEEDTVVPRASLPALYHGVKAIAGRYGLRTVCYGHAGDGNLHVNILKDQLTDSYWNHEVKEAIREIFQLCYSLKGTISGEHGIGLVQKEYMPIVMPEWQLELMRGIKQVFDPRGILNPGKIF